MIRLIHDRGYKYLFANKTIFRQLMETFVNEPWVREIDFSECEAMNKSFISDQFEAVECDMLYHLRYRDREAYVFMLMEFQSTVMKFAALRLHNYISNFYMDHHRQHGDSIKLPPVFPVLLYNGRDTWTAPAELSDLIENPTVLGRYSMRFEYFPIIMNMYSAEELLRMSNLVATLFFAETQSNSWQTTALFKETCDRESDLQAISLLVNWFIQKLTAKPNQEFDEKQLLRVYKTKEEVKTVLMETIEKERELYRQEGEEIGRREGERKGRREGDLESRISIARALLARKFPVQFVHEITELSEEVILKLQQDSKDN